MVPWILFGLFVLWIVFTRFVGKIPSAQAHELVSGGALLLDVRSPGEFAGGHLQGAKNIAVGELGRRIAEVPKDKPVVVYCASGMRSASAARMLKRAGIEAHDLGAMSRW